MNILVLGQNVQGLIAGALLAQAGHSLDIIDFPDSEYKEFYDGCKTGPVTHIPLAIDADIVAQLDLKSYGFEPSKAVLDNPFKKLPFYDGLKVLVKMFEDLDLNRPPYKEKAWRDAWGTFEIGRVLSEQSDTAQSLFARSATLSLVELLSETNLDNKDKANIIALSVLGSKTDPASKGSAAAILPAMSIFEKDGHIILNGSLHSLVRALKQAAMANGANIVNDAQIAKINMSGDNITSITLTNEQELYADHYILDYDPVVLFKEYLANYSLSPMFKKRITPEQNTKECLHLKLVVSELPKSLDDSQHFVAADESYIAQAKNDMRNEGGSQFPMLSFVNVSRKNPSLARDNTSVIDVIAQYFDPELEDLNDGPVKAVIQAIAKEYPGFVDKIIHTSIATPPTQFGQASFIGTMPLLQLFKVFSGYHSMGYDMPIENLLIAGYGSGTAGHFHVNDGGVRIANHLQS